MTYVRVSEKRVEFRGLTVQLEVPFAHSHPQEAFGLESVKATKVTA